MLLRTILQFTLSIAFLVEATPLGRFRKYEGNAVPDRYIVKLKDGVDLENISLRNLDPGTAVNSFMRSDSNKHSVHVFNGFSATLNQRELEKLLKSSDVDYVEEDGIVQTANLGNFSISSTSSQTNAPWNLARLSQDATLGSPPYSYSYSPIAGQGVDIYVVDTGVYIAHNEFGGRASWGATFGGYANADGNGHGTHLAGIAAGATYGVAKRANIVAVKVLSDSGSGSISNIISGLQWIIGNTQSSGRRSVVLIGLAGSASIALDNAVIAVYNAGIPVVVAAGGSTSNAGNYSPGRVPEAITVTACTITDMLATFSAYGPVIDLCAPGTNIFGPWIGNPDATATLSGVSMAAAHVAGLVAYILSLIGPSPPATITTNLIDMSVKNSIIGIPSGTVNRLASNNVARIGITI